MIGEMGLTKLRMLLSISYDQNSSTPYDPDLIRRLMFYNFVDEISMSVLDDLSNRVKAAGIDMDVDKLRISDEEVEDFLKRAAKRNLIDFNPSKNDQAQTQPPGIVLEKVG